MKKIIILTALLLAFAASAAAQPKAAGVRFGDCAEATYQHYLGSNFFEVGAGLYDFSHYSSGRPDLNMYLIYNFYLVQSGGFGAYAGVGACAGLCTQKDNFFKVHYALAPQIAVEYNFIFPLNVSLEFRPLIGHSNYENEAGNHEYFRFKGFANFLPTLSVRYVF